MNIYLLVILLVIAGLFASSIASFIGFGGGIILIPILIALLGEHHSAVKVISYLSIIALSLVGSYKYYKQKRKPNIKAALWILLGTLPMTVISKLFISSHIGNSKVIYHSIYLGLVILITTLITFKEKMHFKIRDQLLFIPGAVVGIFSGTLGISGGVLFIPILVILGGMKLKEAAVTSLVLKLITAIVNIITVASYGDFALLNNHSNNLYWYLPLFVLAGSVAGALIGPRLNKISSDKNMKVYFVVIMSVIAINEILKIAYVY